MPTLTRARPVYLLTLALLACGGSGSEDGPSAGGAAGAAGSAGAAGDAGTAGTTMAGAAGTGGEPTCEHHQCEWAPPESAHPPVRPADAPVIGSDVVHAMSAVRLGDDASGAADAWKTLGYDLDGWWSTPEQGYHCKPQTGGKAKVIRTDGKGGIDNAFGSIVVPLFKPSPVRLSDPITDTLLSGRSGMLFQMKRLGLATTGTDLTVVFARARGDEDDGSLVPPPAGSWADYAWHPVAGTATTVSGAYVTGGVMVARFSETVSVSLPLGEQTWELPLQRAVLSLDMNDPATGHGQLAGIVAVDELATSMRPILEQQSTALCGDSPTFAGIVTQLRGAADIMVDGTQDPAKTCDGISVGMGFETRLARMGDEVPAMTPPDPCVP